MSYKVVAVPKFARELKRLVRKYPSLRQEFTELVTSLEEEPKVGTAIGKKCYKIRLAIKSKGVGKSGGARVITHIIIDDKKVYLLTIYDKSEKENLAENELKEILKLIPEPDPEDKEEKD